MNKFFWVKTAGGWTVMRRYLGEGVVERWYDTIQPEAVDPKKILEVGPEVTRPRPRPVVDQEKKDLARMWAHALNNQFGLSASIKTAIREYHPDCLAAYEAYQQAITVLNTELGKL